MLLKSVEEILKTWECPFIKHEVLISFVESKENDLLGEAKTMDENYPEIARVRRAEANVYANIRVFLKDFARYEGALQCEHCKTPFIPKNKRAKFCSNKCRTAHFRTIKNH